VSKNQKTLVKAFTTLTDYVERTTHWREGGADRHEAKLALKDVGDILDDREGMTLRDYFAAKAMQSILDREHGRFTTTLEFVGNHAYQYADAMLKARGA
jgi:hypothetical protein